MKKFFVCLVILSMILCCVPTLAFANGNPDNVTSVSKSKEATELDEQFNSEITLSLPSAEEQLVTDVVFVLDKSTSTDVEEEAVAMLENLKDQVMETGAKLNVGIVIFNRQANNVLELTELNEENMAKIEAAMTEDISSGTNLHAGILAGKTMLDNDKSTDADRKYMIVVSDGITYMYNESPTVVAGYWLSDGSPYFSRDPYSWQFKYENNDAPDDWDAWMSDAEKAVAANEGRYADVSYDETLTAETAALLEGEYATSVDKALYLSYETYQAAVDAGYHCYAMTAGTGTEYAWGPSFMNYLGGGADASFEDIQNDIAYAVSTGSYVIDTMGNDELDGKAYDFDLVNDLSKIDVLVGGEALSKEEIADDHYGFGKMENGYRFELIYYPDGTESSDGEECIKWMINENISNFNRVQLVYSVHLTNPQIEEGTYGQYDRDGSQGLEGLYTNNRAVLYPIDSSGAAGEPEEFNKPTVSYVVEKQDVTDPDDPGQTTDPGNDDGTGTTQGTDTPKTGDSGSMYAGIAVMAVSAAAFVLLCIRRRAAR